jgi:hypothetical protein
MMLVMWSNISFCQEITGPVLMKEISGKYDGELKNGLAHGRGTAVGADTYEGHFRKGMPNGEGTYTFGNGNVYKGDFVNGRFSGKGTLYYKSISPDSVSTGYWDEGKYLGKVKIEPYVISNLTGIVDPRISLIGEGNQIELAVLDPFNKYIIPQINATGKYFQRFSYSRIYFEQIDFPIELDITYNCSNKIRSGMIYNTIRIKINKPGNWQITLKNQ